jgi:hypothetical protein
MLRSEGGGGRGVLRRAGMKQTKLVCSCGPPGRILEFKLTISSGKNSISNFMRRREGKTNLDSKNTKKRQLNGDRRWNWLTKLNFYETKQNTAGQKIKMKSQVYKSVNESDII